MHRHSSGSTGVVLALLLALTSALTWGAGRAEAQADGQAEEQLWCTGALETWRAAGPTDQDRARALLAPWSDDSAAPAPLRIVTVRADAPAGGDGSVARPYKSLQDAADRARPGDRIEVFPGSYAPVLMHLSGTPDHPITLAGIAQGAEVPLIDGAGLKVRGLIEVRGASHVTVSGFTLRNAPRDGVFVEGTDAGVRNIRVLGHDIRGTGNSAVFVAGIVMRFVTKVDEYRLFDVEVAGNRISRTNEPKGVNEAISLGGGVKGFVIRDNHIFDTRQYGIDTKAGAMDGLVTGNVIHGIARHGIYLDAGSRRVANITVTRNAVFGANNGIVLARESNRDPLHPNLHDIRVVDNLVADMRTFGIHAYRHPDDSGRNRFGDVTIERNCLCGIGQDAVRLGGIGDFAGPFTVRDNLIAGSGGGVWNRIGAAEADNASDALAPLCPS